MSSVDFDAVEALTFEQGDATAPDSRWGLQTVRLSRDGRLHYQNKRRDVILLEITGTVSISKVEALLDALRKTSFPEPPQTSFVPGAGICRIAVDAPSPAFIDVDFYDGLEFPGYSEILQALGDLNTWLRTSDRDRLSTWGLVASEEKRSLMP